jgi:hypothetical protein
MCEASHNTLHNSSLGRICGSGETPPTQQNEHAVLAGIDLVLGR